MHYNYTLYTTAPYGPCFTLFHRRRRDALRPVYLQPHYRHLSTRFHKSSGETRQSDTRRRTHVCVVARYHRTDVRVYVLIRRSSAARIIKYNKYCITYMYVRACVCASVSCYYRIFLMTRTSLLLFLLLSSRSRCYPRVREAHTYNVITLFGVSPPSRLDRMDESVSHAHRHHNTDNWGGKSLFKRHDKSCGRGPIAGLLSFVLLLFGKT